MEALASACEAFELTEGLCVRPSLIHCCKHSAICAADKRKLRWSMAAITEGESLYSEEAMKPGDRSFGFRRLIA